MKKWSIGTKIWFGFYIFLQWVMFIEYATKPITATSAAYQQVTLYFGIAGLIGTALILWLAISHKAAALITLTGISALGALITLFQGNVGGALSSMILPVVNLLITRNGVN